MGQYIRIHVDFDEFDEEDLADHLRSNGYTVTKDPRHARTDDSCLIDENELNHISTLSLCGQRSEAREVAIRIVSEAIGRPL